jgi:flavin reductase (DIM6/NTAB) family NADH-FMN oxidoreductase RutF
VIYGTIQEEKMQEKKQVWKPGNMLYPLPAVMVSCGDGEGRKNIITVAWAGTICTNPAMVSISVRPERYSYSMLEQSREFAVNLVTRELAYAADWCGVKSGRDTDKFREMKLTAMPGERLQYAPIIAESPVNIECIVEDIVKLGSHHMFLAKVADVMVSEKYMNENGKFELNKTGLITYSHGEYFALGEKIGRFGYSVKK